MDLDEDLIVLGDLRRGKRCNVILRRFAICCQCKCSHRGRDSGSHGSWPQAHSKHWSVRLGGDNLA
jgi:hypothetical protein